MNTMVIGLGPEYNYIVEDHDSWNKNNTRYASNHGASLISRTLIDYFNADFIDDFSKVSEYRKEYDLCVVAFATHVTDWRDVGEYSQFVEKLGIKTIAFSLGIQDYSSKTAVVSELHPSIDSLLRYCVSSSGIIGVRGPHTATLLIKNGFKINNIIEIGCPTIFRPLKRDLQINKPKSFSKPLIVYHRTMADLNRDLLKGAPFLGQDFLDEVIFDETVTGDQVVRQHELKEYSKLKNGELALELIESQGIFHRTFKEWFDEIGKHDFVIGARLHGCIAALIQGIPAVMIARDIRVQEIAEFFQIPYIKYEDIGDRTVDDIFRNADFTAFNKQYSWRYDNFMKLLNDLRVDEKLTFKPERPDEYIFSKRDTDAYVNLMFDEMKGIEYSISQLEQRILENEEQINQNRISYNSLIDRIKAIPGLNLVKKIIKK